MKKLFSLCVFAIGDDNRSSYSHSVSTSKFVIDKVMDELRTIAENDLRTTVEYDLQTIAETGE